jgi:hypothetical protein
MKSNTRVLHGANGQNAWYPRSLSRGEETGMSVNNANAAKSMAAVRNAALRVCRAMVPSLV